MNRICWRDVFTFGGAIMAFMIGAGFASGQETLQFFTHLGLRGSVGAIAVTMLLFVWFCSAVLEDGRQLQLESPNMIFAHYCGARLGLVLEWFVPCLYFLALSLMLSGAGAAVNQHFGVNPDVGRFGVAIATVITVLLGLRNLVRIIGSIGPVIIVFTMILGILGMGRHADGINTGNHLLASLPMQGVSSSWLLSGTLYGASSLVALMPFLAGVGRQARSATDTRLGGTFGGVTFATGILLLSTGLMANIGEVYDREIPSLALAQAIIPSSATLFAILLLASIYTTTSPLLWNVCNRVSSDEKSTRYRAGAVILAGISCFGAQLKFSTLVGLLLPAFGYIGLILIAGMIFTRHFRANFREGI